MGMRKNPLNKGKNSDADNRQGSERTVWDWRTYEWSGINLH